MEITKEHKQANGLLERARNILLSHPDGEQIGEDIDEYLHAQVLESALDFLQNRHKTPANEV